MKRTVIALVIASASVLESPALVFAAETVNQAGSDLTTTGTPGANTSTFPKQILRTGINLNSVDVSPNSIQLADNIGITATLERIQTLRQKLDSMPPSPERNEARLDLMEARSQAMQAITRASLEVDFAFAEMRAEQDVYAEILSTFTSDRDKKLAKINAASFISNGALWAVCEGLAIPTHTQGVYAVSSGITGILAGIIPSVASMYTLKAVNGKKKTSEVEPNMLAKLFDYSTNADIEYPKTVWTYLNQTPAGSSGKTRKNVMIDRWISDSNIPNFTKRDNKAQLDVLTASVAQKKGLTIATLSTRQTMLEQLGSEILKIKRMLLELAMVVQGDKQFIALRPAASAIPVGSVPKSPRSNAPVYAPDAAANLTSQAFQKMLVP